MDPIDQLLAQLQTEPDVPAMGESVTAISPAVTPNSAGEMPPKSLDYLLSQVEAETRRAVQKRLCQQQPDSLPAMSSSDLPNQSLLSDLKATYAEHDRAEAINQQQESIAVEQERQHQAAIQQRQQQAKQRRLEQLQAQRRTELIEPAKEWLKRMDRRSEEGRWFEEFACGYDSVLEAAIDYLEALQSVGHHP